MNHQTYVNDRSANNHWRARCTCGWISLPYATREAAQAMAEDHSAEAAHNTH